MDKEVLAGKIYNWLTVINECDEAVAELACRFPDSWEMAYKRYSDIQNEMYVLYKKLTKETLKEQEK